MDFRFFVRCQLKSTARGEVIEALFRELEMTEELQRYLDDKEGYHKQWQTEIKKIKAQVNNPGDASILKLDTYAADVARMCPNVDHPDDEVTHIHGASRNIEHILMLPPPNADDSRASLMGSLHKLFTEDEDEKKIMYNVKIEVGIKLSNEYLKMTDILHNSWPMLFRIELEQKDLASSMSVHKNVT